MSKVIVKDGEDIEDALKRFKRQVNKDGQLQECKKRNYYEKPGVRRRNKQKESQLNKKAGN